MRKPLSSRILFEVVAKQQKGENEQSLRELITKKHVFSPFPVGCVAHAEWLVGCLCSQRSLLSWGVRVEEFFSKGLRKCLLDRHSSVSVAAAGSAGFYFLALSPQFGKEFKTLHSVKCRVPKASFHSHDCLKVLWISDFVQLKVAGTAAEWPLKWNFFSYEMLCTYDV